MKKLAELSFSNIKKQAGARLVNITLMIAGCAIYMDQILDLIHSAPFPVSPTVDAWIKWIVRVAATLTMVYTALSKKKDVSVDVSVKQTTDATPSETSLGKNQLQ